MRKILILGILANFAFCLSSSELYQKGIDFEKTGDYKNAMIYYKLAAKKEVKTAIEVDEKEILFQNSENKNLKISKNNSSDEYEEFDSSFKIYETPIFLQYAYDFADKVDIENGEVKFGFSFEKPLFYDIFGKDEAISFAYTQKSFWQVEASSSPFRESNYMPEIFMRMPVDFADFWQVGLLHESNGQGGVDSRGWNKIYTKAKFSYGNFSITPQIWYAFWLDDYNEDIDSYLGYGDLKLSYELNDNIFLATLRNNLRFDNTNRGSLEFGWMFPIFESGIYGYLSYFTGYGESLIDYNRHVDKIALGFAVLR